MRVHIILKLEESAGGVGHFFVLVYQDSIKIEQTFLHCCSQRGGAAVKPGPGIYWSRHYLHSWQYDDVF